MKKLEAVRISIIYFVLGTVWIFFTDRLLIYIGMEKEVLSQWGTAKGLIYVCLTSGLLFVLVLKHVKSLVSELHKRKRAEDNLILTLADSEICRQQFQSLFDYHLHTVLSLDLTGKIENVNSACLQLLGYTKEEMVGKDIADLLHSTDKGGLDLLGELKPYQKEGTTPSHTMEAAFRRKDGEYVSLRLVLVPTMVEEKLYSVYIVAEDITESKQAQRILDQQSQILATIVEGSSLETILESIVALIEQDHSDRVCSILTLDEAAQKLYTAASPSLPEDFKEALNGLSIGPSVGSCGTAAYTGQTIIVEDIATDPLWENYRYLAMSHQLKSCWSTPIISRSGKVLGAFAMYSKQPSKPNTYEKHALSTYSRLIGMAMEHDRSEERVKQSESRYQLIAENSKDMVALVDAEGALVYTSPSIQKVFGHNPSEMDFSTLFHEDDFAKLWESFDQLMKHGEPMTVEVRSKDIHNQLIWMEIHGNPIYNSQAEIEHALFVARDITERKNYAKSLESMAFYDTLTGLPNRRLLTMKIAEMIGEGGRTRQSFALLCMDCDRFKNLNDSLGYDSGDRFLQMMKERLLGCVSEKDIVARLGGDSFMILLTEIESEADALYSANRILDELRKPWELELDGDPFHLTSSIGVAFYTDQEHASGMVQQAEIAVHQSKRSGKNMVSVYNHISPDPYIYNPFLLEKHLYGALERKEFELWYQPQINYKTGEIIGVEALLRWNHPQWGLIMPSEFILLTEDTGLIVPIGEWALRTACLQSRQWEDAGIPAMHMSVNLSPRQLNDPGFVDMVFAVLEETGLHPNRLFLEITEGILLDNDPRTYEILKRLHDFGIRISVDDFRTGYSSLSYIKLYPVDLIKIDRSFIQDIPEDTNDIAIIKAIVDLSNSLNINVLAEGAEELKQIQCLHELGCYGVQGYFFSKPLIAEHFRKSYPEILAKTQTVECVK